MVFFEEQICQGGYEDFGISVICGQLYSVMEVFDVVLVVLGIVLLEVVLYKKLMVIFYKVNWVLYQIMWYMVYQFWVGLFNILVCDFLVLELLQYQVMFQVLVDVMWYQLEDYVYQQWLVWCFVDMYQFLLCDISWESVNVVCEVIGVCCC